MTISVDSIKRRDTLNMKKIFASQPTDTIKQTSGAVTKRREVKYATIVQYYARELNNGVASFLELTSDNLLLEKAMQWSVRAIEFYQTVEGMNTYALLLYKTGKKEEAIKWQSDAIALREKQGYDTKNLKKELLDMKTDKTSIGKPL